MQSTNVEYLFENYSIAEIEEIQRKLKMDIERKKEDLKQLVGERYRDLIEAADTIQDMNGSVQRVLTAIKLLQSKSHLFASNNNRDRTNEKDRQLNNRKGDIEKVKPCRSNDYEIAMLMKVIINTPLEIWSFLEAEDLVSASIYYLYGQHVCQVISRLVTPSSPLLSQYENAINRFITVIDNACWDYLFSTCSQDTFDDTSIVKAHSCLIFINNSSAYQLFTKLLQRRTNEIEKCFSDELEFQQSLNQCVSIIFNTIKSIYLIFYDTSDNSQTLLHSSILDILTNVNNILFVNPNMKKNEKTQLHWFISRDLEEKKNKSAFYFRPKLDVNASHLDKNVIKTETLEWIKSLKSLIGPLIKGMLTKVDSIEKICFALQNISKFQKNEKNEWEDYCEELMGNYWPIWEEFLMESVMQRMRTIIDEKILHAFTSLQTSIQIIAQNVSLEDLEIANFVFNDSPTDSRALFMKANGFVTQIEVIYSQFDEMLWKFLDGMKILKQESKNLPLNEHNIHELYQCLIEITKRMITQLCTNLSHLMQESDAINSLFIAQLLRNIFNACPNLKKCFENYNKEVNSKWEDARIETLSLSFSAFNKWFDSALTKVVETSFSGYQNPDFFLSTTLAWDEVVITEETEDGKKLTSNIQVPLQISLALHSTLTSICEEMNQRIGHVAPRSVTINILMKLAEECVKIYNDIFVVISNDESKLTASVKQTYALQWYFDLLFLKQFVATTRDETIRAKAIPLIHQCFTQFESLIDPFDLHVFFPHIQTNLSKCGRSSSILFGLLVAENTNISMEAKGKLANTSQAQTGRHNIMSFSKLDHAFPSLSLTSMFDAKKKKF